MTGSVDGTNTTFTLATIPFSAEIYLNGLLQQAGGNDYSQSGGTITFGVAPPVDSIIEVWQFNQ